MMRAVFIVLGLLWSLPASAQTPHTIACNAGVAAIESLMNSRSVVDGDTVVITGSCTITDTIDIPTKAITVAGQGIGVTVLTSGLVACCGSSQVPPLIRWATKSSGTSRLTGFSFLAGTNCAAGCGAGHNGYVTITGGSKNLRIDHNLFEIKRQTMMDIEGWIYGVIDHNTVNCEQSINGTSYILVGPRHTIWDTGGNYGDQSFARPSSMGSGVSTTGSGVGYTGIENLFFENNEVNGNRHGVNYCAFIDADRGARIVARWNVLRDASIATHGLESDGRYRSVRHQETYRNYIRAEQTNSNPAGSTRGGTGRAFQNVLSQGGMSFQFSFSLNTFRSQDSSNRGFGPWGHCGDRNVTLVRNGGVATATVTSGATLLCAPSRTSAANSWITMSGAGAPFDGTFQITDTIGGSNSNCANFNQTGTQFTYNVTASGATSSSGTYRSPFDTNTDSAGYRCMDQAGAGQTISFSGSNPVPVASSQAALEPFYLWDIYRDGVFFNNVSNSAPGVIVANRDYYSLAASDSGLRSARPACTTDGQAYWSTDGGGNWNQESATDHLFHEPGGTDITHTLGEDGGLDRCNGTSWVNDWYVPYAYPHPLR